MARNKISDAPENPGELIIVDIETEEELAKLELLKRGFFISSTLKPSATAKPSLSVGLGPRLVVRLAVQQGLPKLKHDQYTQFTRDRLVVAAIPIIERMKAAHVLSFARVAPQHNPALLAKFKIRMMTLPNVHKLNKYFGSEVALYYGFTEFYLKMLLFPATLGIALFVRQQIRHTTDTPLMPAFTLLIACWGTGFLELWKRQQVELTQRWGTHGAEGAARRAALLAQRGGGGGGGGGGGRGSLVYLVSVPLNLAAVFVVFRTMLYAAWLSDNAEAVYGEGTWQSYIPTVLYSVVPVVYKVLYRYLAEFLNRMEPHPTAVERHDALQLKLFAFTFVNSYLALLYNAFWKKDYDRLHDLLFSMLVTKAVVYQVAELAVPFVKGKLLNKRNKSNSPSLTPRESEILDEINADQVDMDAEYLELAVQFGYVSMFAVAFPLAPAIAMLTVRCELFGDLWKLKRSARPTISKRSSIGFWYTAFNALGFVAVLTNCGLLVSMSTYVDAYLPDDLDFLTETTLGRWLIALVLEHALVGLKLAVAAVVEDEPWDVRQRGALAAAAAEKWAAFGKLHAHGERDVPPGNDLDPARRVRAAALALAGAAPARGGGGGWAFGPWAYAPLLLGPLAVGALRLPAWLTLPAGAAALSYLQRAKDAADLQAAVGIVSDPQAMKLVHKKMPGWFVYSEMERMDWWNRILQRLWPTISDTAKHVVMTKVNDKMNSYRPQALSKLGFKEVTMGSAAPKVTGVRVYDENADSVRLDMDFKWAGNAKFVVEAGYKALPFLIELSNIHFTGKFRVELAPLLNKPPCVGAVSMTCLTKPHVDFAFKLANLNTMSLGVGDANIGNLVSSIIKKTVQKMFYYPKMFKYDLIEKKSVHAKALPTAIVQVTVARATGLRAADLNGKSDPFVECFVRNRAADDGDEDPREGLKPHMLRRTPVVSGSLNPVWTTGNAFNFPVVDRFLDVIHLEVLDKDVVGQDFLGYAVLQLGLLQPGVTTVRELSLTGPGAKGTLEVRARLLPLGVPGAEEGEQQGKQRTRRPAEGAEDGLSIDELVRRHAALPAEEEEEEEGNEDQEEDLLHPVSKETHRVLRVAVREPEGLVAPKAPSKEEKKERKQKRVLLLGPRELVQPGVAFSYGDGGGYGGARGEEYGRPGPQMDADPRWGAHFATVVDYDSIGELLVRLEDPDTGAEAGRFALAAARIQEALERSLARRGAEVELAVRVHAPPGGGGGGGNGKVRVGIRADREESDLVYAAAGGLTNEQVLHDNLHVAPPRRLGLGALVVHRLAARDVRGFKAYLALEKEGMFKIKTAEKTDENPKWDNNVTFICTDLEQDTVSIKLMEQTALGDDRVAGSITVRVAEVLRAKGGEIEKDFELESGGGGPQLGPEARLHARLLIRTYTGTGR